MSLTHSSLRSRAAPPRADLAFAAALVAAAVLVNWVVGAFPAQMPVVLPWEFSWIAFLGTGMTLWWFFRGLARLPAERRPPRWRIACFLVGMAAVWIVLQTHYLYLAEHMFFFNRIQHVVMHHAGPFLIALGAPGAALMEGMPPCVARALRARPVRAAMAVVQQPVLAGILFVGLIALWLVPPIHARAMLDAHLFWVMNWSMVVDGILFWWLVLDPRPSPPARARFGVRLALAIVVMFPQIVMGAVIALANRDLYPYYDFCGRVIPDMSAHTDQVIGGIVIWIPSAMMSVIALLFVLSFMRLNDERMETSHDPRAAHVAALSKEWTGR
jgi:putative membrane protein